ncbi:MAG TPA: alanine--glyoxylate aminotransferase family protein [Solirubrobacteraceae bacterium]|jgi:alanine-glyoxylate transaminase/serine-glyoxylate transaminase/serine-pyruvate transaminase
MNPAPLHPPQRLLCGPGPSNVTPAALEAMQRPLLGHLDPALHELMDELVAMLRATYRASSGLVLPLQATGTSGMEAGLAHLLEPGETAIIAVNGFFGRRVVEIARRVGAEVVAVEADWGQHVSNDRLLQALDDNPAARLVVVVHAETSTGVEHPLAELGAALRDRDVLLMADCVTSLGGVELDFDGWGVDFAYSCTQKCLGAPPGMSPLAISDRALERIGARNHPLPYSYDLGLLERYWIERPAVYHHTAPVLHIYALYEALREVTEEGLERRWQRHSQAAAHLQDELRSRGLKLLAEPDHQLAPLTAIRVPEAIDGKRVQTRLLLEHEVEIGGGLGPSAPAMWRIGLMGYNARIEVADRVLAALDAVLADEPALSPA